MCIFIDNLSFFSKSVILENLVAALHRCLTVLIQERDNQMSALLEEARIRDQEYRPVLEQQGVLEAKQLKERMQSRVPVALGSVDSCRPVVTRALVQEVAGLEQPLLTKSLYSNSYLSNSPTPHTGPTVTTTSKEKEPCLGPMDGEGVEKEMEETMEMEVEKEVEKEGEERVEKDFEGIVQRHVVAELGEAEDLDSNMVSGEATVQESVGAGASATATVTRGMLVGWICEECGTSFSKASGLQHHLKVAGRCERTKKRKVDNLTCPRCLDSFQSRSSWRKHVDYTFDCASKKQKKDMKALLQETLNEPELLRDTGLLPDTDCLLESDLLSQRDQDTVPDFGGGDVLQPAEEEYPSLSETVAWDHCYSRASSAAPNPPSSSPPASLTCTAPTPPMSDDPSPHCSDGPVRPSQVLFFIILITNYESIQVNFCPYCGERDVVLRSHLSTCTEANTPTNPVMPGTREVRPEVKEGEALVSSCSFQPVSERDPTSSSKVLLGDVQLVKDPSNSLTRVSVLTAWPWWCAWRSTSRFVPCGP